MESARKRFALNLRNHRERIGLSQEALPGIWGQVVLDCPRNPPKTPPETAGTLVVCTGQIVLRRTPGMARLRGRADVAQLVEHLHGKEGVRGSSPRVGFA